jgi:hypothetical protein
MERKIILALVLLITSHCFTQEISDSTYFYEVQKQLIGCWKTKHYQFKYRDNVGGEYKSRVRSSAPLFNLIIKDEEVYLIWIELIGGEHYQKVKSITNRKLIVENEDGTLVTYRRNKDCSSQLKGIE